MIGSSSEKNKAIEMIDMAKMPQTAMIKALPMVEPAYPNIANPAANVSIAQYMHIWGNA